MVCVAQVRALSPEVWCVVKTSLKRIMIKVIQGEYPARTKTNHRITGILSIWTWPCFGQGWCFKPHNSLQNISDSPSKRVNRFLIELLLSFQAWRCTKPLFPTCLGDSWVELGWICFCKTCDGVVAHQESWQSFRKNKLYRIQSRSRWWFQTFFYVHLYLWKWSNLTHIFWMGWNHQQEDAIRLLTHGYWNQPYVSSDISMMSFF